jgi:chemotaxis signal transduction protein
MTKPLEFLVTESTDSTEDNGPERERRDLLIARRSGRLIGVFANAAEGIVEWKTPAPLPAAKPSVLGLVCVRGRMFTVVDPMILLTIADAHQIPPRFVVLLSGEDQLALAVERVARIAEIFVDEIERVGEGLGNELVWGRWHDAAETVTILNPDRIFAVACRLES